MSILFSDNATIADYFATGGRRLLSTDNRRKINPSTGLVPVIGNNTIIRIPKSGDAFLSHAVLEIGVNAVTATGGTFARLINAFGFFCMDRIELRVGGELITTIYPKQMDQFLVQHTWAEELEYKKSHLGYLAASDRSSAASAPQTFYVELNRYFSLLNTPFPISLLADELEFTVYWATSLAQLIETDGSNPVFSFDRATINVTYAEPHGQGRELIKKLAAEANSAGLPIYSEEILRITRPWSGSAATNQFQLTELNNRNVIYMNITDSSNVVPSAPGASYDPLSDLKIATYRLENSGKQIHGAEFDITDEYFKNALAQEYSFLGIKELKARNIYSISYSDDLKDEFEEGANAYAGSMSFKDMNSVTLKLEYSSAAPANRVVTINVWVPRRHVILRGKLVLTALD